MRVRRYAVERCKRTMFKQGHKPKNYDPIGTEKLLADGYVWVKVDDKPKGHKKDNWEQKHRLIWKREHGDIPQDHIVMFADQDRHNFAAENLILVTRTQLVRMNQNGLIKENGEATKTGVIIADLMTKLSEVKKKVQR